MSDTHVRRSRQRSATVIRAACRWVSCLSILRVISLSGCQGTSDGRPYSLSEVYYRYHNFWGVDKGKDEEKVMDYVLPPAV